MSRRDTFRERSARSVLMTACATLLAGSLILLSTSAGAHAIGLSRGEYRASGQDLEVTLVLARAEATAVVPLLDADGRGAIDASSLAAARSDLGRATIEKIHVTTDHGDCAPALVGAALTEQDGLEIRGRYRCPRSDEPWTVTLALLDDLSHGHRHAAHVALGSLTADHLVSRNDPTFTIDRAVASAGSGSTREEGSGTRSVGFLRMGIEHILSGYDHLLFLFALVLAGGTIRSLALAVTSFTVAHSVTLALAVLGFVAPPARWIEPAIALSVAYVGVENFFPRRYARAWITFPFGLVHGFGFAGALGEIAIPRPDVPVALLSFNAGVEIGQLACMIVFGVLLAYFRRWRWFARSAVPALSALIVAMGLFWFVGRLRDPATENRGVTFAGLGADDR